MDLPHCAVRAKQHYGIDLSWSDVGALVKRCKAGEGKMETCPDGTTFHTLIFDNRMLWCVYRSRAAGASKHDGVILTIMPPNVGSARARRDYHAMVRRRGEHTRRWKPNA
jgi:hypothetical protein